MGRCRVDATQGGTCRVAMGAGVSLGVVFLWVLTAPPTLLLGYFALETALGLRRMRHRETGVADRRAAVLIPAHDEAEVIGGTVAALRSSAPGARIVVVADNCIDDTAGRARPAGAEVIVRNDTAARGKGHGLAFGRDHLRANPPDAVIVLDADCRIDAGGVARLAERACGGSNPVQAANLMVGGAGEGPQVAISNFAMMVKNLFRARGMMRLGGGGLLFGTGMAFPWSLFERLPLATSDSTEDIRLGLELAREGRLVALADNVRVTSPPAALAHSRGQRSRWEHGFLRNMASQALPLVGLGIRRGSRHLVAIGMHMMVPPLALLVAASLLALAIASVLAFFVGFWIPVLILLLAFFSATAALVAAWARGGREVLAGSDLVQVPRYILWKLPIYAAFFRRRHSEWNRTSRKG